MAPWTSAAEQEASIKTVRPSQAPPARSAAGRAEAARRVRRTSSAEPIADEPTGGQAFGLVPAIDEAPIEMIDAARLLLASLQQRDDAGGLPTRLGFTSAIYGEGVTFVSRAVAAVLAHDFRERVCLVDLNWGQEAPGASSHKGKRKERRRARRAGNEGQQAPGVGLADALRREALLRDIILETEDPRLTVVAAGRATAAEGQIFARAERLTQILEALERHHDRLVFDLPPVLASSAAIPLARHAGGIALVVRQGVTTEAQVRSAHDRLGATPSLGVVLNRASSKIPRALLRRISNW